MNSHSSHNAVDSCAMDISDEDVIEAMKEIGGYLDITPGDFRDMYRIAYQHAVERLVSSIRAGDVMNREVISVRPDTDLGETAKKMAEGGVTGVPVIDGDRRVVGVISEKDFLRRMGTGSTDSLMAVMALCMENDGCSAITMRNQKARDIMSSPAVTVEETTPLSEVAGIFTDRNVNRAPVVDAEGRLLGIIARSDIVRSSCFIGGPQKE